MTPPANPWTEHRDVAEAMATGIALAVGEKSGDTLKLGMVSSFDPDAMISGRPMPVRAIVVDVHAPLRDQMIFLASAGDGVLEGLVETAVPAALAAIDAAHAAFEIGEVVALDSPEWAVDQCDALFLEATYELPTPQCELRFVLGTGLLESAHCFVNGVSDPFAHERHTAGGADAPADAAVATTDAAPAGDANGATFSVNAATAAPAASPLTDLDAELAAAEAAADAILSRALADQAETVAAAAPAIAAAAPAIAAAEAAPAALPAEAVAAVAAAAAAAAAPVSTGMGRQHWASLLSDVEVEISAELGRTNLPLGDFNTLHADSVLTLDTIVDEPVTVFVNGTAYAQARLVVVGGEYGIEILEVLPQAVDLLAPLAPAHAA